jgi:hypothetical protein
MVAADCVATTDPAEVSLKISAAERDTISCSRQAHSDRRPALGLLLMTGNTTLESNSSGGRRRFGVNDDGSGRS